MKLQGQVLLLEDDADVRAAMTQSLDLAGMTVAAYGSAEGAMARIDTSFPGVVVSDLRLPGMDGRDVFRAVRKADVEIPVILVTGHGELQEAVDLMREGLYDFVSKPFPAPRLVASVRNALEQRALVLDNRRLRQPADPGDWPVPLQGESSWAQRLREHVVGLADTDVNVLVTGETGTGKHAVARALHERSRRRTRPFIILDCAAFPDSVAEIELFGIDERHSGLTRHRPGRIETADRGTLFIDNIDSLSLATQARLLRAVEEKQVTPVGANIARSVDCRIVAASAADLEACCVSGLFRKDLYYRLNTVTLALRPLRERREDIARLLTVLVTLSSQRLRRPPADLTTALRRHLLTHHWPGNIRELAHLADRLVLGLDDEAESSAAGATAEGNLTPSPGLSLPERMEAFEAKVLDEALRAAEGDVRACLEMLRIPRKTFYDKLARHSIDIDRYRRSAR